MTKYILEPRPLAEECFLFEALNWLAFHMYPIALDLDPIADRVGREKYCKGMEVNPGYIFFNKTIREKHKFPPDPVLEELSKGYDICLDYVKFWHNIAIETADVDDENTSEFECLNKGKDFKRFLEEKYEVPKNKICVALREGQIKAFGKKVKTNESFNAEGLKKINYEEIPPSVWKHDKINWDKGWCEYRTNRYIHVKIQVENLLTCFSEAEVDKIIETKQIAGNFVLEDYLDLSKQAAQKASRGKKPIYSLPDFLEEVAIRFKKDHLPTKQDAFIADMTDWCKKTWGISPKNTWIKDHIRPFYKALKNIEKKDGN